MFFCAHETSSTSVSTVIRCASAAVISLNGSDMHDIFTQITFSCLGQRSYWNVSAESFKLLRHFLQPIINSKHCAWIDESPDVSYIGMYHIQIGIGIFCDRLRLLYAGEVSVYESYAVPETQETKQKFEICLGVNI